MSNEKKLNELEEMEAAKGEFGESESTEGMLNDAEAADAAGGTCPGIIRTISPRRPTPTKPNLVR